MPLARFPDKVPALRADASACTSFDGLHWNHLRIALGALAAALLAAGLASAAPGG